MKKLHPLYFLLGSLFFSIHSFAQPANDECINAIHLDDVTGWCSGTGAYSNAGATAGSLAPATCFPNSTRDVWFSFEAVATTVHVAVIGRNSGSVGPGGTLLSPQFAIYSGSCTGTLTQIQCASDGFSNHIVETFAGPLTVGQTYYIRVDARNGNTGTFRLCVNNYNAVPNPSGDCPTGVILCDKSPFTVTSLIGTGNLNNEFSSSICIQSEFASAWYRWTCKDAGTLAFTITPTNPSDDIDFAIFELPGGINDCSNKTKIRCEAAGENVGQPFSNWAVCTGPTGLSIAETDTDELPGCNNGNNNFVSAINMVAGRSYALIINNFSNTGNGFSIEFSGTGTFVGPAADFSVPATVCQSQQVSFTDQSTAVGGIQDWSWNFGIGASPSTATGVGPHNVTYNSPGPKSVVLTITSSSGCKVTTIKNITVLPQPQTTAQISADYCGVEASTGIITLQPSNGTPPYQFRWQNSGTFTSDNTLADLQLGPYSVTVRDANGCQQNFNFVVPEGLSLEAGADPVRPPTCNGDSDGSISISIAVANYPVTYDFGNGPQPDSVFSGIPAGTYNVHVVDAIGCEGDFTITVNDYPPMVPGLSPLNISCFGANDGRITAVPTGGAGTYTYLWNTGATTDSITNLSQGSYTVTVTDVNGCTASATANIQNPSQISIQATIQDVLCNGDASGVISVSVPGGTPPYEYSADGVNFQSDPDLGGLTAGIYTVTVRDSRGCMASIEATVNEPPLLIVEAGDDQTISLGHSTGLQAFVLPNGHPVTISWSPPDSLDCLNCLNPTASPFATTTYYVTVTDPTNCTSLDSVTINVVLIRPIYIPSALSPDGNGTNDFFTVYGGPAARIVRSLKIFDRWGEMVYHGKDLPLNDESYGWDGVFRGKPMDSGVFVYLADVEFIDGVLIRYEGDFTIIR